MAPNSNDILPEQFIKALNDLGFDIHNSDRVEKGVVALHAIVQKWNTALGYDSLNAARFRDFEKSAKFPDGLPIAPIPFTATGWPIQVVFWGLNPHYDDAVLDEKSAAYRYGRGVTPGTWEAYAHFYLNYPFNNIEPWPGSLKWAISSNYYYNLGTITATLKSGRFTLLNSLYPAFPPSPRLPAFWSIAQDYGVMAVEYLPFHSQKAALPPNLSMVLGANSPVLTQSQRYHETLLQTIEKVLAPGGWIVAMGKACTQALRALLQQQGVLSEAKGISGGISLETWTPKGDEVSYKVSFGPFIGTAGGPLNSNVAIQNWLEAMLAY